MMRRTVTIRNLSVEDAGLYWCGVKKWVRDIRTEVNLDVVQAEVQAVTTENAFASQTISSVRMGTTEPQDQQTFIRATTQSGNYTELDVVCGQCHSDDKIIPKNTSLSPIQSPDSIIYAIPTPRCNRTRSLPSHCKPAGIQGCSGETQLQHPEAVVYCAIPQSGTCPRPQSYAPFTSTRPVSIHVSKLYLEQRSHVLSDTPAISEESHDVCATVKWQ
ncbi:uncharacterized protein LOC131347206 [Hemibagrus wyckioides]|uniref:uncharacterized protein LOC131347206 n=1 Tax=Hemibagrus wyckioides TaxID=337641 RepID=UPI00266D614F|nr:uncharacterized protein LOC131347206 [Hemibagrus wyckioides]